MVVLVSIVLFGAAAWKVIFLIWQRFPFNSDEAIVGLMARHILQGARPVFFYGQSYMGSLDAWLTAVAFSVFGQQVWVIRLVQTMLYLGIVASSVWIVWRISGSRRSMLVTGLLLAIPTVNVLVYTTVSLGGYNEALLFGNLILAACIEMNIQKRQTDRVPLWLFAGFGLSIGLGIWAHYLTIVYTLPGGLFAAWILFSGPKMSVRRITASVLAWLAGVMLGFAPVWVFAIQQGIGAFLAGMLQMGFSTNGSDFFMQIAEHLRNFLLFGLPVMLGIRPPWTFKWLALPLLPFVLAAWSLFTWKYVRQSPSRRRNLPESILLSLTALTLLLAFLFSYFGADPSGRYFLPFYVLSGMGIGLFFSQPREKVFYAALGVILVFNAVSTFQCALEPEPGLTTQFTDASQIDHTYDTALIQFLTEEGETRGYSNYWVTYPLAFLSDEKILFSPALPYEMNLGFNPRDDRYPLYSQIVQQAHQPPAYIITRQPELETRLREAFSQHGITWEEKTLGNYQVFYHLSETFQPADLGLSFSQQ